MSRLYCRILHCVFAFVTTVLACSASFGAPTMSAVDRMNQIITEINTGKTMEVKADFAEQLAIDTRNMRPMDIDNSTLERMISLLAIQNDPVRAWVAAALGNIGPRAKSALPTLLHILREMDRRYSCHFVSVSPADAVRLAIRRIGTQPPRPPACHEATKKVATKKGRRQLNPYQRPDCAARSTSVQYKNENG